MPEINELIKFLDAIAGGPGISGVEQEAANSIENAGGNFDRDACLVPAQERAFKPQSPAPGMIL